MADGRHFENGFIAISQPEIRKSSDLNEIWFYRYNSAGNHPISAQFSVLPQVTLPRTVT